ncbi:Gtr1/RagA G protein conserved region-domain-containing protein [Kockiozyma suomiensis]|uniref:Gtr1/RagA G protein conserved region-domain-containing protein n=1 Tax=Kockiozyma suomiensis TaxID=1337062 RepID=UPI0033432918
MAGTARRKLLLMGRSGSGKSSMRSIIFSNYSAFDTRRLGATIDVEHQNLRFLGNMTLSLWDCGGQDAYMDNYFSSQRDNIFQMVEALIFVFDVESKELRKDIETFVLCLRNLYEFSPSARIFALVHKMDLVVVEKRQDVYRALMHSLEDTSAMFSFKVQGFATTIWDESLYKAWSNIVCSLIPNVGIYQKHLQTFAEISEVDEVILFEKTTFLVLSHVTSSKSPGFESDSTRFEKISNIIKQFKQSCNKLRSQFQSLSLRGSDCSAYLDSMTASTMIMVVMANKLVTTGTGSEEAESGVVDLLENDDPFSGEAENNIILANIKIARKMFEKIEHMSLDG